MLLKPRIGKAALYRAYMPRATRGNFLILGVTLFLLFLLSAGRSEQGVVQFTRSGLQTIAQPVLMVISSPMHGVQGVQAWWQGLLSLREENHRLKLQVAELTKTAAMAVELQAENNALRKLVPLVPQGMKSFIGARVVALQEGTYLRTALVNAGANEGVKVGQAVVAGEGLIGRITEVAPTSARLVLLTDMNSRVPVMGELSRERAIASGTNDAEMKLEYVKTGSKLSIGERLITSGDGGMIPQGLPVGFIVATDGGNYSVQPYASLAVTDVVNIIDYKF